ncbi:MAG: DUF1592 domain-containing protein, partial [Myxococcota bacterium]|nr:DUF1592 domain-containing protein [Myxococcota bacterium]
PILLACQPEPGAGTGQRENASPVERATAPPDIDAPTPALKRLTTPQYVNALRDLFGSGLVLPASLEPDQRVEGLFSVGAARTSISSYGVEKYESAAFSVAGQVMEDEHRRTRWVTCAPSAIVDDACAAEVLSGLGEHAWRRPLTTAELDTVVSLADEAAAELGDFHAGLEFGIAALLTSPHFLYRVELGDEAGAPPNAHGNFEMASRLSFFLWNTIPDGELLEAAAAGELTTDAGIASQVDRMLADDRARDGVRGLYTEMLHLDELDELNKDTVVFTYMRDTLGPAAREETLLGIEALAFDDDASYLELFETRRTFLNRELAALYDVPAPVQDGFGETWLPEDGGRTGLFGHASFLALNAHAVSTSVTLRGIFIREVLLCQDIPEPPANADTSIPEVDASSPTMRDRIAVHLEVEECASCHRLTDPIGLGFENFDGIGRWRLTENGAPIDPSGELDGVSFADGEDLGHAVAQHPRAPACMTRTAL